MKIIKKLLMIILVVIIIGYSVVCGVKMLYPLKYNEYIEKYCIEYEIDPYFVMGIIKAESNFDDSAVSQKGATGLMQITKGTAEWIAHKIETENFVYDIDIINPEINIHMGVYYISYLLDMYEGNHDLALAAYNAGFNNVDKWLLNEEYSNDGKSLDKIPFSETEKYINKVNNNYKIYKVLYKEG